MIVAAGQFVKSVADCSAHNIDSGLTALIEPCKDWREGMVRIIEHNTVVHEAIHANGGDIVVAREAQLLDDPLELRLNGADGERCCTLIVSLNCPLSFCESSNPKVRIE